MTSSHDPQEFTANMLKAAEQAQRVVQEFWEAQAENGMSVPVDPFNVRGAFMEFYTRLWSDPEKLVEAQWNLWGDYLKVWQNTAGRLLGTEVTPAAKPEHSDRRFQDPSWQESTLFDFIKQSYLVSANWLQNTVQKVDGMDDKDRKKVEFYTQQFVDAMSPSNFLMTNPEVLRTTLESNGENLVTGLQHMLEDLKRGHGKLDIRMTDLHAFKIGQNLATTPGKVIYQNDLIQLIQYSPATKEVYKRPVMIIPAWINKFYILDMRPENSYIRWLVEQGYTVFVMSWVNPNRKLAQKSFDDYLLEGPITTLDIIEQVTGEKEVTAIGYCLGGTLLAVTLSYLHAKKQGNRIRGATYFTTMTDFSESGDLGVFVDEEQLRLLEEKMQETGYLEGREMALTFSMLRANDLIWSFVVNNYLLGREPFPFDLLYWNSDATRMPARMHSFYLRNMYQKNLLVKPGGISVDNVPIDLGAIKTPSYMLSTREDHIAPWEATYKGVGLFSGPVKFVLAQSGHIAGVINPPAKKKYGFWTNNTRTTSARSWVKNADFHEGSWWTDWHKWNAAHSGSKVPARKPGGGKFKAIEDAPGSYVQKRSSGA